MNRLGILPAGGQASRFGGLYKELLPVSNGENALQGAYRRLLPCDRIVVITTPEKIGLHATHLPHAHFILSRDANLWHALQPALAMPADEYYFTMPDTVWQGAWPKEPYNGLSLGLFETYEPERFGVLHGNKIHDKATWPQTDTFKLAWGAVSWNREVRDLWLKEAHKLPDFTAALNLAMKVIGYACFQLSDYHDFANLDYYTKYLTCLRPT